MKVVLTALQAGVADVTDNADKDSQNTGEQVQGVEEWRSYPLLPWVDHPRQ
ncbi:MAG: hypothetical protein M9930_03745 [Anaerolineae bacterium]|nr:hypothetical protein [Anaerolineae bacterium]